VRDVVARLRGDPVRVDCLVAAVLSVTLELEVWLGGVAAHERVLTALLGLIVTGAVAVRRLYPVGACVAAGVVVSMLAAFWGEPAVLSIAIAWFCTLYGLAVWATPRGFVVGAAVVTLASVAAQAGPIANQGALFGVVTLAALVIVRRVVGDRERRAQIAERERDLATREAVVEERARIARELHDVIAHHVSMIVIQAGAERSILTDADSSTREVLETVEQTGRGALVEMRRLLGVLRSDTHEPLAPQPGLDDVPMLVGQLGEAGLPVELRIDGERRVLPVGIELSAYRIVQEALTNALKHAGEARATVCVRYASDALELEIADDGEGSVSRASGGGHGLVGMRERVALYGGRFDAGQSPTGGFVVRVVLPVA
jgi:signal transduction histidine kinase